MRRLAPPVLALLAAAAAGATGEGVAAPAAHATGEGVAGVAGAKVEGAAAAPSLPRLHAVRDRAHGGRIVDARGRQVLLRGVNVNALAQYWKATRFRTTFPLERRDPRRMAAIGWNAVRLLVSWSRVEPRRGHFDARYLDHVAATVKRLRAAGIYTILDVHQDAWGATLAARTGETCAPPATPALGWDGAPAWATLVSPSIARCVTGERELAPAVRAAWGAFWTDRDGIQRAYAAMWGRLARRFAGNAAVAGFDLMNEPNAFGDAEERALSTMYGRALKAIRRAETAGHGFHHLVLFEPSVLFSAIGAGAPPAFNRDPNLVYAPHIYTGGFDNGPITRAAFAEVAAEARALGGVPVVSGEWGSDPKRAGHDPYFVRHQALQDQFRFGATLWTWRESCGDPHKVGDLRAGRIPEVWGEWNVSCRDNRPRGMRKALVGELTRGWVRAAPGRLTSMTWNAKRRVLTARGRAGRHGGPLVAFVPHVPYSAGAKGLEALRPAAGGAPYLTARPRGGKWALTVTLRH